MTRHPARTAKSVCSDYGMESPAPLAARSPFIHPIDGHIRVHRSQQQPAGVLHGAGSMTMADPAADGHAYT